MKQNCVTTTMGLLTSQGGWFVAPGPRRSPLMHVWHEAADSTCACAHNVGVGGEAMGAKHFVLTVSQEVCHPKPSIFV